MGVQALRRKLGNLTYKIVKEPDFNKRLDLFEEYLKLNDLLIVKIVNLGYKGKRMEE
mgnify:CR=1 FL=1